MPEPTLERARERRDYERSASIISKALGVVGSSDLAMKGLTSAVKRVVKTPQQTMTAEWLKNYVAPGSPGNQFFKNVRHLHPNVRKRYVAGVISNLFYWVSISALGLGIVLGVTLVVLYAVKINKQEPKKKNSNKNTKKKPPKKRKKEPPEEDELPMVRMG